MTALVAAETVLLVVVLVLLAGLLRSHAELLRRLGPAPDEGLADATAPSRSGTGRSDSVPAEGLAAASRALAPAPPDRPVHDAPPLRGVTPAGDPVALSFPDSVPASTLLAFLSSGCTTCAGFWEELAARPLRGVQTVIVTRGADRERPARIAELAPRRVPVVLSSSGWEDYRVPGAPYFVLVGGQILGEGVATTWHALASLVSDALADVEQAPGELQPAGGRGPERAAAVDARLAAAGIRPEDPSLYPAGPPP